MWIHPNFKCKHNPEVSQEYNKRHDAYYCKDCDVWIEDGCSDPECDFCPKRPSKPSEVK